MQQHINDVITKHSNNFCTISMNTQATKSVKEGNEKILIENI